jgi:protein involved in polysaccharide export with SLBB domain
VTPPLLELKTTLQPPQAFTVVPAKTNLVKIQISPPPVMTTAKASPLEPRPTAQSEPQKETNTPPKAAETKPQIKAVQEANTNAVAVNLPRPESETTQETPQEIGGPTTSKSDDSTRVEQKQEPAGVRLAMSVMPTSMPVETKTVSPTPIKTSSEEASLTRIYRVGPNDVLDVQTNDSQSPKSTLFTVTSAGLLEYPMLTEPLPVTGLTVEEIGAVIERDLKKRAVTDDPKVVVGVRDYGSHSILVSGLVKDSGTKFLRREAIPLYVVVADAQPLPEAARVSLVRNELNEMYEIDLAEAADMNLLVHPGDVITLHPNVTQFVYIGGEVKFPGEKTFRRGLTLTQAIITAGEFQFERYSIR